MPELPEVETVARSLLGGQGEGLSVLGRRVVRAGVGWKRSVALPAARSFQQRIIGRQVIAVGRRGKFIKIDLSEGSLLIHLRMSGDLLLGKQEKPLGSHSRVQIYFDNGLQMSFNDPRKFGRVWLVEDADVVLGALGPEPFDPALTPARFHNMLVERKRQLKPLLLDQTFIAGLGNIYADEALWSAKLNPLVSSAKLTKPQSAALLRGIRKVLAEGIRRNGASIDWVYRGGEFQNHFNAYQRTGEKCPRCGSKIKRIVVGQRSTHFCPNCQKLKRA
jgi:formamidopyrimidine-DNA glycosylase